MSTNLSPSRTLHDAFRREGFVEQDEGGRIVGACWECQADATLTTEGQVICSGGCDIETATSAWIQHGTAAAAENGAGGSNGGAASAGWCQGFPMDPAAVALEPIPPVEGFPFAYAPASVLISGPTGGGRSSLLQAGLYDAARAGLRCAYIGGEVTQEEFNARAADLARRRGDIVDAELRADLERVRYLPLAETIDRAWRQPDEWVAEMIARYDAVGIDPVSTVAATIDRDFDKSNADYVQFHGKLIQPLVNAGVTVLLLDNIGHDTEARKRAKGASAKQDLADVTLSCHLQAQPAALIVTARKVRSVRAPFSRGDEWLFDRETQRITRRNVDTADTFRPTTLMERVSRAVEQEPGLSRNEIRAVVKGKASYVDTAVGVLIDEHNIAVRPDGQKNCHHVLKPYRVPESLPGPDRVPNPVEEPGPPESPYVIGDPGTGPGSSPQGNADRVPGPCKCSPRARKRQPREDGPDFCHNCKGLILDQEASAA